MSEWISTKDKLPKHGQRVLFCGAGIEDATQPWFGYFFDSEDGKQCFTEIMTAHDYDYDLITHWQSLPELPTQENNKKSTLIDKDKLIALINQKLSGMMENNMHIMLTKAIDEGKLAEAEAKFNRVDSEYNKVIFDYLAQCGAELI